MTDTQTMDLVAEVTGRVGILTLNRGKALNALDTRMARILNEKLAFWAVDDSIDAVVIRSSTARAFCAGGDVRAIGIEPNYLKRQSLGRSFFGAEYAVNYRINKFPKPYIALINGLAMGGGLGLSVHGSHRVVCETTRMAMPETALGLFPDVGASWFLSRCPGYIGRYLALIGSTIDGADAIFAGLATHHMPEKEFPAVLESLQSARRLSSNDVDEIVSSFCTAPGESELARRAEEIDRLFATDDLSVLRDTIANDTDDATWIVQARKVLESASPASLHATWMRMIQATGQPIEAVLSDDYRMAVRMVGRPDFAEGVRAILVDKDRDPQWTPAKANDVSKQMIDTLLDPFDSNIEELRLPA